MQYLVYFWNCIGVAAIILAFGYSCKSCNDSGMFSTSPVARYDQCLRLHLPSECRELKP